MIGFAVGLFVGAFIGISLFAIVVVCHDAEERERDLYNKKDWPPKRDGLR